MRTYMHICIYAHIYAYTYKLKCERRSRDRGVQTNGVTQFWHGLPTHKGKIYIFDKIGLIAAPHQVCTDGPWALAQQQDTGAEIKNGQRQKRTQLGQ